MPCQLSYSDDSQCAYFRLDHCPHINNSRRQDKVIEGAMEKGHSCWAMQQQMFLLETEPLGDQYEL